jgi:hypothetical protein
VIAITAIVFLSAVVRIAAARTEFWFDEVWSLLAFAQKATSPLDVFGFHHDNNHHLMTLWMYVCGMRSDWMVYRIPSIVAGIGTIVLAALIARQWGWWGALSAAVLTGSSFVLITYASEARGYALAGFFALAAWYALDRYLERRSWTAALLFALSVVLCLLSHVTAIFLYAGTLTWSMWAFFGGGKSLKQGLKDAVRCHAAPLAFLAAFYALHIRDMTIGGGPQMALADVVTQSLALAAGGTNLAWLKLVLAVMVVAAAVYGLISLRREGSTQWSFFLVGIFVAPAIVLWIQRPSQLYPRYFYLPLLLLLVLLSYVLTKIGELGAAGRWLAVGVLALIVVLNTWQTYDFLRVGRGQYIEALRYMADGSSTGVLSMQSDHDYESKWMLTYYQPYLPAGTAMTYMMQEIASDEVPEWTIVYGQQHPFRPHASIVDARRRAYDLQRVFPYAGLSGYHWALYRRR